MSVQWIGESAASRNVLKIIRKISERKGVRLPYVLLRGETGVGKGVLARSLHHMSARRHGPFVSVNCSAISESLAEGELFGHAAGAFTDAKCLKRGLVETADGGVLFLDEVGLLSMSLQAKLLKLIEDRSVRRLGETEERHVDMWVVAATNEDPLTAIKEGRFRRDLYHRLAVVTVDVPPLRQRGNDVLLMAEHLLREACARYGLEQKEYSASARELIARYPWPGNIREMENEVERVILVFEGLVIEAEDLSMQDVVGERRIAQVLKGPAWTSDQERECLRQALAACGWNVSHAATRCGVSRQAMYRKIKQYGWRKDDAIVIQAPRVIQVVHAAPLASRCTRQRNRRDVAILRIFACTVNARAVSPAELLRLCAEQIRLFGGIVAEEGAQGATSNALWVSGIFGCDAMEQATQRAVKAAWALTVQVADRWSIRVGVTLVECPSACGGVSEILDAALKSIPDARVIVSRAVSERVTRWFRVTRLHESNGEAWSAVEGPVCKGAAGVCVGRERELEGLQARWVQASGGQGQCVGIVGRVGIGKSRLLREVCAAIGGEAQYGLVACVPHETNKPYRVVAGLLRSLLGIHERQDRDIARRAIERVMGESVRKETKRCLAKLLGLDGEQGAQGETDLDRIQEIGDALVSTLRQCAAETPIVCIVEDLQWIDAASEACLKRAVEGSASFRVLFLCTYRPEYQVAWRGSHAWQVGVESLCASDARRVVEEHVKGQALEYGVISGIVERAGGNPLFLEELSVGAREGASSGELGGYIQSVVLDQMLTLEETSRRVLEVASVVGMQVPAWIVEAICGEMGEYREIWRVLSEQGFIREVAAGHGQIYRFCCRVMRDAVHGSLTREVRKASHLAVAEALLGRNQEQGEDVAGMFAEQYAGGEAWGKASRYLVVEGRRLAGSGRHEDALEVWTRAEDYAQRGHGEWNEQTWVSLFLGSIRSLVALGRFAMALQKLESAEGRVLGLNKGWILARYYYLLGRVKWLVGDHDGSLVAVERSAEKAMELGEKEVLAKTYVLLSEQTIFTGDLVAGVEWSRRAMGLCHQGGYRRVMGRACWMIALGHIEMGRTDDACAEADSMVMLGTDLGDAGLVACGYWTKGLALLAQGHHAAAVGACRQAVGMAEDPLNRAMSLGWLGYALVEQGSVQEGMSYLKVAIERLGTYPYPAFQGWFLVCLGDGLLRSGEIELAKEVVTKGVACMGKIRLGAGWAERVRGRIAVAKGETEKAAAAVGEALLIFDGAGAKYEAGRVRKELSSVGVEVVAA